MKPVSEFSPVHEPSVNTVVTVIDPRASEDDDLEGQCGDSIRLGRVGRREKENTRAVEPYRFNAR